MTWTFRTLVAFNLVLLAVGLFYQSPGEDPAGSGLRLGLAVLYAAALAAVLLVNHYVTQRWVRVLAIVLLTVPLALIGYGIYLSV